MVDTFGQVGQTSFQDLFNQLVGRGSQPDLSAVARDAMVFTSTLRQLKAGPQLPSGPSFQSAVIARTTSGGQSRFISVQTQAEASGNQPKPSFDLPRSAQSAIKMAVNPKAVRFEQPKRYTKKDTLNGSVFYHFTNNKGQNNDILTITFRGNTGNIDRRGSLDPNAEPGTAVDVTGALNKLIVWHNLYLLTREPIYIGNGVQNRFTISYISPLMPFPIDFVGFFTRVLEFEEVAEKPYSRDYSMQFIVQETHPDLDTLVDNVSTVVNSAPLQPVEGSQIVSTPDHLPSVAVPGVLA